MITNILISEASELLSAPTGLQEPQFLNRIWIWSLQADNDNSTELGTYVTPQLHPTVTVIDALLGTDTPPACSAPGLGDGVLMLWLQILCPWVGVTKQNRMRLRRRYTETWDAICKKSQEIWRP